MKKKKPCIKLTNRKEDEIIEKIMKKRVECGNKSKQEITCQEKEQQKIGNRRNHVGRANKAQKY